MAALDTWFQLLWRDRATHVSTPDPTDPEKAVIHPRALETLRYLKRKEGKASDEMTAD